MRGTESGLIHIKSFIISVLQLIRFQPRRRRIRSALPERDTFPELHPVRPKAGKSFWGIIWTAIRPDPF